MSAPLLQTTVSRSGLSRAVRKMRRSFNGSNTTPSNSGVRSTTVRCRSQIPNGACDLIRIRLRSRSASPSFYSTRAMDFNGFLDMARSHLNYISLTDIFSGLERADEVEFARFFEIDAT